MQIMFKKFLKWLFSSDEELEEASRQEELRKLAKLFAQISLQNRFWLLVDGFEPKDDGIMSAFASLLAAAIKDESVDKHPDTKWLIEWGDSISEKVNDNIDIKFIDGRRDASLAKFRDVLTSEKWGINPYLGEYNSVSYANMLPIDLGPEPINAMDLEQAARHAKSCFSGGFIHQLHRYCSLGLAGVLVEQPEVPWEYLASVEVDYRSRGDDHSQDEIVYNWFITYGRNLDAYLLSNLRIVVSAIVKLGKVSRGNPETEFYVQELDHKIMDYRKVYSMLRSRQINEARKMQYPEMIDVARNLLCEAQSLVLMATAQLKPTPK